MTTQKNPIVKDPNLKSIINPSIIGERALAKTMHACIIARIAPKFFTPYNSAHNDPVKGSHRPLVMPKKAIYKNMKIECSKNIMKRIPKSDGNK